MADTQNSTYVFTTDALRRSVDRLVSQPIHEHFMGYLAILRYRRQTGEDQIATAEITQFFRRYLELSGDSSMPFVSPFRSRSHGKLVRINSNPAGSYAASSFRGGMPASKVMQVTGTGKNSTLALRDDHVVQASAALLKGKKVPCCALAAFLYRDYGFELEERDVARVLALFRDEFGLRPEVPAEDDAFSTLFHDDIAEFGPSDLIELEMEAA